MTKHALLVGISNYTRVNTLPTCDNDAADLRDVLTSKPELGWANGHVRLMTSASDGAMYPSKGNFEQQVMNLFRGAATDDTVLFFFSGHGDRSDDGKQYLCPIDYDGGTPEGACVSLSFIKRELSDSLAKCRIVWLDACHSGGDAGTIKGPYSNLSPEELAEELTCSEGSAVFASCKNDEVSWVSTGSRNSVWAGEIIKSLQTPDDLVEDELLLHDTMALSVTERVRAYTRAECPRVQSPVLQANTSGPIVLGDFRRAPKPDAEAAGILLSSEITVRERRPERVRRVLGDKAPATNDPEKILGAVKESLSEDRRQFLQTAQTRIRQCGIAARNEFETDEWTVQFPAGEISYRVSLEDRNTVIDKVLVLGGANEGFYGRFLEMAFDLLKEVTVRYRFTNCAISVDSLIEELESVDATIEAEGADDVEATLMGIPIRATYYWIECRIPEWKRDEFLQTIFPLLERLVARSIDEG